MPILCQDHVLEASGQPIHDRHDLVAMGDRKRPIWAEVVLNVDDEENVSSRQ